MRNAGARACRRTMYCVERACIAHTGAPSRARWASGGRTRVRGATPAPRGTPSGGVEPHRGPANPSSLKRRPPPAWRRPRPTSSGPMVHSSTARNRHERTGPRRRRFGRVVVVARLVPRPDRELACGAWQSSSGTDCNDVLFGTVVDVGILAPRRIGHFIDPSSLRSFQSTGAAHGEAPGDRGLDAGAGPHKFGAG